VIPVMAKFSNSLSVVFGGWTTWRKWNCQPDLLAFGMISLSHKYTSNRYAPVWAGTRYIGSGIFRSVTQFGKYALLTMLCNQ
jgi:hypothetical protein